MVNVPPGFTAQEWADFKVKCRTFGIKPIPILDAIIALAVVEVADEIAWLPDKRPT